MNRNGQEIGPYTKAKAMEYFTAGQLLPGDLAWDPAANQWVPLPQFLGLPAPMMAGPVPTGGGNNQFPPLRWYIHVLKNYAKFEGRASRAEYWWFFLTNFLIMISLGVTSVFVPFMGFLYMA